MRTRGSMANNSQAGGGCANAEPRPPLLTAEVSPDDDQDASGIGERLVN